MGIAQEAQAAGNAAADSKAADIERRNAAWNR